VLVRIFFPGISLLVLSAFCIGVLNSHGRFFLSYAAPVVWSATIIVALIAVAAIGVVTVFGKDIRELFAASTGSLAGEQGANNAKKAKVTDKTMKTFSEKE